MRSMIQAVADRDDDLPPVTVALGAVACMDMRVGPGIIAATLLA